MLQYKLIKLIKINNDTAKQINYTTLEVLRDHFDT